jgi:hypothetical protein
LKLKLPFNRHALRTPELTKHESNFPSPTRTVKVDQLSKDVEEVVPEGLGFGGPAPAVSSATPTHHGWRTR